ncbi:hypothetical protein ACOME3_007728 [Neoechinorhynchus agilis]
MNQLVYSKWLKGVYVLNNKSISAFHYGDGNQLFRTELETPIVNPHLIVKLDQVSIIDLDTKVVLKLNPLNGRALVQSFNFPLENCEILSNEALVCFETNGLLMVRGDLTTEILQGHYIKNGYLCSSNGECYYGKRAMDVDPLMIKTIDHRSGAIVDTNNNVHVPGNRIFNLNMEVVLIYYHNNVLIAKDFLQNVHCFEMDGDTLILKYTRYEDLARLSHAVISANQKRVYVLSESGSVYCLGAGGRVLWMQTKLGEGKLLRLNSTMLLHITGSVFTRLNSLDGAIMDRLNFKETVVYLNKGGLAEVGKEKEQMVVYMLKDVTTIEARLSNGEFVWTARVPGDMILLLQPKHDIKAYAEQISLPNGTLIHKYCDPHMLTVISSSISSTYTTVFNSKTGHILYQANHGELCSQKSLRMISTDNWVAYTCKSENKRFGGYLVAISFFRDGSDVTSRTCIKFLPPLTNVVSLGVSETSKALTPRSLLFATKEGTCFIVPWSSIDPCPDAYLQDPRFIFLPQDYRTSLNKKEELARVRGIETSESGRLESVSLAFVFGSDLMLRSFTPSEISFDALREDFDRRLIAGIMAMLTVSCFLAKLFAQRSIVKNAWV